MSKPKPIHINVAIACIVSLLITFTQVVQTSAQAKDEHITGADSVTITARVVDENNTPVIGTTVTLEDNSQILNYFTTDTAGFVYINIPKEQLAENNLNLVAHAVDYRSQRFALHDSAIGKNITIQMVKTKVTIWHIQYAPSSFDYQYPDIPGSSTTIKSEQIEKMPH